MLNEKEKSERMKARLEAAEIKIDDQSKERC